MGLARIARDAGFGGRLQLLGADVPVLDGGFVQRGDRRHVSQCLPDPQPAWIRGNRLDVERVQRR